MSHSPESRRLMLVVGAGRSGTSLTAGVLSQLGFHVPQPEVQADFTNPRGFGEPRWVVDFHARLMAGAGVGLFDARPEAWKATASAGAPVEVVSELTEWLRLQFRDHDRVVVKDPRTAWFLPLWAECAQELGLRAHYVIPFRHPTQVLRSIRTTAGDRQTEATRAAWWVSTMLNTERATRDARRAFVQYDDIVSDWRAAMTRIERVAEVPIVAGADEASATAVDGFVDPTLRRSPSGWTELDVPSSVQRLAEQVWAELGRLAVGEGNDAAALSQLDALRDEYAALYREAAAIADSTVQHAVRTAPSPGLLLRFKRRLPPKLRKTLGRIRAAVTPGRG